jgi:hypothetical protein
MRKLKFPVGTVLVLACAGPVLATPIACPTSGTVATLIGFNGTGDGCLINGLVFNNFTFNPTATGTGTVPTATQVTYNLDDPGISTGTGQMIYGFEFNPDMTVLGIGSEDFTLDYTITAPSPIITSIHLLEVAAVGAGATATVSETDLGCTVAVTSCTTPLVDQVTPTAPHEDLLGIGPFAEIEVTKDVNVTSTTPTGIAGISDARDAVDLASTDTPEPASYALLGAGLILLGCLKRRGPRKF